MRKGLDGLAVLAKDVLRQDPFSGHLFVFRGRRGDLIKVLWWDAKRLEKGRFVWPSTPARMAAASIEPSSPR